MELVTQQITLKAGRPEYALAKAAVDTKPGATYGYFLARVNVDAQKSWRMVYDEKKIYALFESNGYTATIYSLFVAGTREECVTMAKALGLDVPEDSARVSGAEAQPGGQGVALP
jgi:hypothetical protein